MQQTDLKAEEGNNEAEIIALRRMFVGIKVNRCSLIDLDTFLE